MVRRFESEFTGNATDRWQIGQLNVFDSLRNVHLFNSGYSSCWGSSNASLSTINHTHQSCTVTNTRKILVDHISRINNNSSIFTEMLMKLQFIHQLTAKWHI